MKLSNVHGFDNINDYVKYKLSLYSNEKKSLETLFQFMFDETDNVMIEITDGYRIKKITYGMFKENILTVAPTVAKAFSHIPCGGIIGLYMENCPEWLTLFWAVLAAGYRPLLLNTRLPENVLNSIISEYNVSGVISDSCVFCVKTVMKEEALVVSGEEPLNRPFGEEVIFMSSGTSDHIKLSVYNGENFYHQICDSVNIVETCPAIAQHYNGELKHLVLLPLYHIFGFAAVYLWFGFFSRTFVFPKDLNPLTVQRTVKKHGVTHIFAVPMVWDAVAKAATNKIKSKGAKTHRKFSRMISLTNSLGSFGDFLAGKLLSEVRENLFGESIMFLISGGGEISKSTLEFFNGIGYHLANGYGMTEVGITSVEKSCNKKILNSGSIGTPFGNTKYSIDEAGKLLVYGKSRAFKILCDGKEQISDFDCWFNTGDIISCENGRYYAKGRCDDLIIGENGENLNPNIVEPSLYTDGIDKLCIVKMSDKKTALVVSVPGCYAQKRLDAINSFLAKALAEAKLDRVINRIYFTFDSLLGNGEFKVSRTKIAQRIESGKLNVFDPAVTEYKIEEFYGEIENELRLCFAEVLQKEPSEITKDAHFFRDLGGTSIDYFALLGIIKSKFNVEILGSDTLNLATVSEFACYLKK